MSEVLNVTVRPVVIDVSVRAGGPQGAAGPQGPGSVDLAGSTLRLAPLFPALKAAATTPVDVLFVGDSITEGQGSTVDATLSNRWIQQLINEMRSAAGVTGGRGYVPAYYDLNPVYDVAAMTNVGGVEEVTRGLGRRAMFLEAGDTLTLSVIGTAVDVVYRRETGAGTFDVSVGGGAPTNVNAAAAPYVSGGFKQRIVLGASATYSVQIAHSTGAGVYIEGIMVYNGDETSGVRLWDAAKSGYTASSLAANLTWFQSLQAVNPDLVVIALGTNDFRAGRTPAQFSTDIQTIITKIRTQTVPGGAAVIAADVPIIIVHYPQPTDGTYAGVWADYRDVLAVLAGTNERSALLDLSTAAWTLGADNLHPNTNGHTVLGRRSSADVLAGHTFYSELSEWLESEYSPDILPNPVPWSLRPLASNHLPINPGASTVTTFGNGVANFQAFDVDTSLSVVAMECECTTVGAAGSVVRLGIYGDNGAGTRPNALLVDAGTVDTAVGTGVKTSATIAATLAPGRYWAVAVGQGAPATAPIMRVSNGVGLPVPLPSLPNLVAVFPAASGLTAALPSTAPALSATPSSTAIRVALLLAS